MPDGFSGMFLKHACVNTDFVTLYSILTYMLCNGSQSLPQTNRARLK